MKIDSATEINGAFVGTRALNGRAHLPLTGGMCSGIGGNITVAAVISAIVSTIISTVIADIPSLIQAFRRATVAILEVAIVTLFTRIKK